MTKKSETVVFFGSGPVAARSLDLLVKHTSVEAVVTKPRPAHHKGEVPVLELAEKQNLRVLTPANKQELSKLFANKPFTSELGVVIDYGIIIAKDVIDYFPLGIINSHFSLLPEWRGADPITFAILSGQAKTGVSIMLINEGLDEGNIIGTGEQSISATTTAPELTEQLVLLSDTLLQHNIPRHFLEKTKGVPQEVAAELIGWKVSPTYSRKLTKDDGLIDWNKPAEQIEREIRAFIEWPKSRTVINSLGVVITSSKVVKKQIEPCGKFWVENKQLFVSCGKDSLEILALKPAGKKEMPAKAFLAGYGSWVK